MTEYSGRTTSHAHKSDSWKNADVSGSPSAIQQKTVFEVQWTDCPVEVEAEVRHLWRWMELGNDNFYFSWDREEGYCLDLSDKSAPPRPEGVTDEQAEEEGVAIRILYPLIDEFLMSRGVKECLIHWWW